MLTYFPRPGQILMCDFGEGFKEPEAVKRRPVIVLTVRPGPLVPSLSHPGKPFMGPLVTVVALSTQEPTKKERHHLLLPKQCMPQLGPFQEKDSWIKGDMIYAVCYHRLDLIQLGKRDPVTGKRLYFTSQLGRERMREVYACVLHALNIGHVAQYL